MQKSKVKSQKFNSRFKNFEFVAPTKVGSVILIFAFCILNFMGCATVPTREALPTYNLHRVTYLPLISLCELRNIDWQYDTFTKTAVLSKYPHQINLMVGETLVLVDGAPQYLKHPVDIYQGTVVVPYKFKQQILDSLFIEPRPITKPTLPLSKIKKVVIDAGHGGGDPGAIGRTGLREKDVTLDIAKRLAKLLRDSGIDVVMVRSSDRSVSLESRVDIANNSRADLFISIHANANRVKSLNGFEVYYVSPYISDSKRALSTAQNAVLDLDSSCFASRSQDLKATLWDMIYTFSRAESIELSRSICRAIDRNLNIRVLGIKGANFYVLKGVYTPAVLTEVGFLSNHNEERLLKNTYYRQQIAEAIAQGIENYGRELALTEASR